MPVGMDRIYGRCGLVMRSGIVHDPFSIASRLARRDCLMLYVDSKCVHSNGLTVSVWLGLGVGSVRMWIGSWDKDKHCTE